MATPQHQLPLPDHLQHRPVFGLPFFDHDPERREGDTDCQHLSIGWSQWDDEVISAKILRHAGPKWSRQSEEIPLARLVDLASFIVLAINNRDGNSLVIPAEFFENQPNEVVLTRQGGSDREREFYRQSLVENEVLQRRLDKLTDVLIARRRARGAKSSEAT